MFVCNVVCILSAFACRCFGVWLPTGLDEWIVRAAILELFGSIGSWVHFRIYRNMFHITHTPKGAENKATCLVDWSRKTFITYCIYSIHTDKQVWKWFGNIYIYICIHVCVCIWVRVCCHYDKTIWRFDVRLLMNSSHDDNNINLSTTTTTGICECV